MRRSVDVAILGGGLGGNLLARQLARANPNLEVALFERQTQTSFKVGESTVELATNYLIRRQGLSTYLYDNHLPKNGLRFFFDTPQKNAELTAMSEIGSRSLPYLPSFQLNRARFEEDLLKMNADMGVGIHRGYKVENLSLEGGEAQRHTFTASNGESSEDFQARWVVDATGRTSMIARQQKLRVEEPHSMAAVWGRVKGVKDLDDIQDDDWRARARHTCRQLSTNHFCYPGYWIWFIPLRHGITSIGVVCEQGYFNDEMRKEEGFKKFLQQHRAVAWLLEDAEFIDIGSFKRLAYGTQQYFSPKRWGLLGEAAAFTDPFYSPGSDFIALECDFLTDLITREAKGDSPEDLAERCALYDGYMKHRFDTTMKLYRGQYSHFGSFELLGVKFVFDLLAYYNTWLHPFMRDEHLHKKSVQDLLRRAEFTEIAMDNFSAMFRSLEKTLRDEGRYHAANLGQMDHRLEAIDFAPVLGQPRRRKEVLRTTEAIFNKTRDLAQKLVNGGVTPHLETPLAELGSEDRLPLYKYMFERELV